jgi:hypothetical protein
VITVYHKDVYTQGFDKALGQINVGLQQGCNIKGQWYRLQDKMDQNVGSNGNFALIQLDMSFSKAAPVNDHDVGISDIPRPIPSIAKASPAGVTRRAAPVGSTSIESQRTPRKYSSDFANPPVDIEVMLDMDYKIVSGSPEAFRIEIANDLARAVSGFPEKILISGVRTGSVIVEAQLIEGLCPDMKTPLQVLEVLQRQVHDRHSVLKQGKFSRHVVRIDQKGVASNLSHNLSKGMGSPGSNNSNDMDYTIMDIPLQIDTDSPDYPAAPFASNEQQASSTIRAKSPPRIQTLRSAPPPVPKAEHSRQHAEYSEVHGVTSPQVLNFTVRNDRKPTSTVYTPDHPNYNPSQSFLRNDPRPRPTTYRNDPKPMPTSYRNDPKPMPIVYTPDHPNYNPSQAYQNPLLYPSNRGLAPHQLPQPSLMNSSISSKAQPTFFRPNPLAQMQTSQQPTWLPIPTTWYERYKQSRSEQKILKSFQREEAMEKLRQQERQQQERSARARAGEAPPRPYHHQYNQPMQNRVELHVQYNQRVQSPNVFSPSYVSTHAPSQAPMPVPKLKENHQDINSIIMAEQPLHQQQLHQQQLHQQVRNSNIMSHSPQPSRPSSLVNDPPPARQVRNSNNMSHSPQPSRPSSLVNDPPPAQHGATATTSNRPLFSANQTQQDAGRERIAKWLDSQRAGIQQQEIFHDLRDHPPLVHGTPQAMPQFMPRPMEPNLKNVFAGSGMVRFHPVQVNGVPGAVSPVRKRYESFSGHNTPTRDFGTFSPTALSAVTAPTPRVNSSLWSSMDIPLHTPAFPYGYDPSKPYGVPSLPPGAFSIRAEEIYGSTVANPLPSVNQYVQHRGRDVVIQPRPQTFRVQGVVFPSNFALLPCFARIQRLRVF